MVESYVQTNLNKTAGKKLKTFESVDTGGNVVEAEAVVLVDGAGDEIRPATEMTLEAIASAVEVTGTLQLGNEFLVTSTLAVMVLPANPNRRGFVIQNNGLANVRVGPVGISAVNGPRLPPGESCSGSPPFLPDNALWAIAEGADTIVFSTEIV